MHQNKNRDARRGRMWSLFASLALVASSGACVDTTAVLELQTGSAITVQPAGAPAPLTTNVVGNIGAQVQVTVDVGSALAGNAQNGKITTKQILIAGSPIQLAPGVDTGTVCVSIDPMANNEGMVSIDALGGTVMITTNVNAQLRFTNPAAMMAAGGPIPLVTPVSAKFPVPLATLIQALSTGVLPFSFKQAVMGSLATTVAAPFGGSALGGQLSIVSPPTATQANAMIEECRTFLASQGIMVDATLGAPVAPMAPARPGAPRAM